MKLESRTIKWLRRGSFAIGIVAAAILAIGGRVPAHSGPLGLDVHVSTSPTGELAVAPRGNAGSAHALLPGRGSLTSHVTLLNQTDAALAVRVAAAPSFPESDRALHVELSNGGAALFAGTLAGFRHFVAAPLELLPHRMAKLELRAWLPVGAPPGWQGREVEIPLAYHTFIAGGQR